MVARKPQESEVTLVPQVTNIVKPGFNWKNLYLYMVSLITLLIALFSLVNMLRSGVSLIYPNPTYIDPNATGTSGVLAQTNQDAINKHSSILGVVDGLAGLIVSGPLYLYHWKLARRGD